MKTHTTNYINIFIEVSLDSPVQIAEIPAVKGDSKTIANLQFNILNNYPYKYTSDEALFEVFALKNELTENEKPAARIAFFSKGQPCMRCSPLGKRYGWGIHHNENGKVALISVNSQKYVEFLENTQIKKVKAMKNKK